MKRRSTACLIIFSMVFASQLALLVNTATACGMKEPETLISLYEMSDLIVVASYNGITRGSESGRSENYVTYDSTESFEVLSTIVGDPVNRVTIETEEYVSTRPGTYPMESSDESGVDADEEDDESNEETETSAVRNGKYLLEVGDKVLLFLTRNDETGKLQIADYADGIKRMPDETLEKYIALIKRLDTIYSGEERNMTALVEWLIDAAVDPDTRWEAAYTLLDSAFLLERYERLVTASKDGDAVATDQLIREFGVAAKMRNHSMNFVQMLTDQQKDSLARIVVESAQERAAAGGKVKFVRGDADLMRLVAKWNRSDVSASMLAELRNDKVDRFRISLAMQAISTSFDDEELEEMAEAYADQLYESDKAQIDDDDDEEENGEAAAETDDRVPSDDGEEAPETSDEKPVDQSRPAADANVKTAKPAKVKRTFGEMRAEIKARFIARAEMLAATR